MSAEPTAGQTWIVSTTPLVAAAKVLASSLAAAGSAPRLAVSGGSAATALQPLREHLGSTRWSSLRLTWVDERRVPLTDADSNRGAAHRAGWVGPAAPVGLELPLWWDDEQPATAVDRVTRTLRERFDDGLDAVLLGMGEDGHIASLFPGHAALQATGTVALIDDSPKPPPARITLTLPCLARSKLAVLVATGVGKREVLAHLRAGDERLPATRLPGLTVITDQDLA